MREQRTKAQVKKNKTKNKSRNYKITHPPIICNNNTINIEFLVQMRLSDKCGSVRNDDIFKVTI